MAQQQNELKRHVIHLRNAKYVNYGDDTYKVPVTAKKVKDSDSLRLLHNGGVTFAVLMHGDLISIGAAVCSDKDMYNKAKGRELATSRANTALDGKNEVSGVFVSVPNVRSRKAKYRVNDGLLRILDIIANAEEGQKIAWDEV